MTTKRKGENGKLNSKASSTIGPEGVLIPEMEIRVTPSWVRLIRFCQVDVQHGDIKVKIVNAQPTKLLDYSREIRFDKEMTSVSFDDD